MLRRHFVTALAGMAGAAILSPAARADDDWPRRPVRLVVPYPPGGPVDGLARVVSAKLGDELGQPVIVENKGGAGGSIGLYYVIKAAPDGSVFGFGVPGAITALPQLQKLPYTASQINYVSLVGRVPQVVAVNESLKVNTFGELLALAKSKPGQLNYGSAGVGTTPHLGAELLRQLTGINIVHVPYTGAAPAVTALMSNEIQLLCSDLSGLLPFVSHGIRILAVCMPERVPQIPSVPTTAELGLPGLLVESDYGIVAPQNTPQGITDKFRAGLVKVLAMPDVKQKIGLQGAIAQGSTPDQYRQMMLAESQKWAKVIKAADIRIS
ncbi:Bug family tripartite tricarboxylate transporter substrate binding protein [Paraburkholderia caballeronis]|uniref:Bug family tripartite tricarboxylate transporter substrate binding protein n=1 Tax=Paraburkholderia caballeronis TaxID=416943 RepID=UPI00106637D5|nr:tripartite tricarboxylate transporter substrate binding protein [Paraburkholderia caballeronis]TDV06130.1 tripartite-type tricarboxylate transporter receptor subunit TctC [Paraburkholderia caballeronis]TDV09670.1 tripartite-type tricarboxylate transporter receptor subunit TctC [Paraburkholderia caballeronis]TDV21735.1 tripartite-type tricarboxylate transporter receptor subunit TctC [Paraburkholderia caballeronis]TDV36504.1 tripartite-type tricarboxylate transporter receptor subunit TctC [Par